MQTLPGLHPVGGLRPSNFVPDEIVDSCTTAMDGGSIDSAGAAIDRPTTFGVRGTGHANKGNDAQRFVRFYVLRFILILKFGNIYLVIT